MAVQTLRRLFTVDEYHRMAQAGILSEDDRIELIEGEIVWMSPIGSRHARCVRLLNRIFSKGVGDRAIVDVQNLNPPGGAFGAATGRGVAEAPSGFLRGPPSGP